MEDQEERRRGWKRTGEGEGREEGVLNEMLPIGYVAHRCGSKASAHSTSSQCAPFGLEVDEH
jgi:hypothetical protein